MIESPPVRLLLLLVGVAWFVKRAVAAELGVGLVVELLESLLHEGHIAGIASLTDLKHTHTHTV